MAILYIGLTVITAYVGLSVLVAKVPRLFLDSTAQRMDGRRMRGNALLVIAHPDDECMFFAPIILSFLKQRRGREKLLVLCLSNGDFGRQDGQKRQAELFQATQALGLGAADVTVIDSGHLKDNSDWNEDLIANIVHQHCIKNAVKTVITFDEFGVSGHKNHVSIFHAVKRVPDITLFALETVSLFRKYTSLLDLPLTLVSNHMLPCKPWTELLSFEERSIAIRALYRHQSQMVWFRVLYSIFSRYLFLNTFQVYK